jgi:hypothetical protein
VGATLSGACLPWLTLDPAKAHSTPYRHAALATRHGHLATQIVPVIFIAHSIRKDWPAAKNLKNRSAVTSVKYATVPIANH